MKPFCPSVNYTRRLTGPLTQRLAAVCGALLITSSGFAADALVLSSLFTDHMVLQRDTPIPIWGKAASHADITVTLDSKSEKTKADDRGNWSVKLPARKAGGPLSLTVASNDETTAIKDILVGDVWLCSGQSNMEFQLRRADNAQAAIASSANNNIRLYHVPRQKSVTPLTDLNDSATWQVAAPDTVPEFSAVGYFFGKKLQQELDIPIGLIESSWGGTKVQWWTPLDALDQVDYYRPSLETVKAGKTQKQLAAQFARKISRWLPEAEAKDPGTQHNWAAPDLEESGWNTVNLPVNPKRGYLAKHDGTVWYRRTFDLPAAQINKPHQVQIGCIDDIAVVYINGQKIGSNPAPMAPLRKEVPPGVLKPGKNQITVQLIDVGGPGGICGAPGDLAIVPSGDSNQEATITLSGEWKTTAGIDLKALPAAPRQPETIRSTVLYNAMIAPLVKFPIAGAIWYQGEGNASFEQAPHYAQTFSTMIKAWRSKWGLGDFPFLFVQLASFKPIQSQPGESSWALLREQQEKTLEMTPGTAMASAVDVGNETDIHPKDKLTVGNRLATAALILKYDRSGDPMGPIYKASRTENGKMILEFTHGKGLHTPNGEKAKGFAIAGADGKFVWADANIQGDTVVVSSPQVSEPTAVRYGWADFSTGNLYNESGLPASPFRTDKPAK